MEKFPENNTQSQLNREREKIDTIDKELVRLLNERALAALAIGAIKRESGLPVFVKAREEAVIEKVMAINEGPLSEQQIAELFTSIMTQSKQLQRELSDQDKAS